MGSYKETFYLPDAVAYKNVYDAMRAVLKKWRTIVAKLEAGYNVGNVYASSCAFCKMYNTPESKRCKGCPIAEWSGETDCQGTSWADFSQSRPGWGHADPYEELEAARKMLNDIEQVAKWLASKKISTVEKLQREVQDVVPRNKVIIKNRGYDGVEFEIGELGQIKTKRLLEINQNYDGYFCICRFSEYKHHVVRIFLSTTGDC